MAQPRTYTRQFNFNDFQTTSPANPLPGVQVDTELNTVKLTLDDLNTNIAKIQQDDGKIKNQSVHKDSFDAGALALMKTGSYSIQGDWSASRTYAVGDLVDNNGATYVATVAHTSSSAFETDLTANNWILIANAGIANTASTVDKFEGTGSQTAFTLSSSYTSNTDVMVFVNGALKNPGDDFSISTNTITFVTAPSTPAVSGNENVIVFGTSVVAQAAKEAAQLAQTNASGFANEADNWARKTTGLVESTDYSSKAYAIGGTGVDNGSGSAKDWATKTSGTVGNTGEYSAKYYATNANVGTVATNIASINTLAGINSDVTTVAGISTAVSNVSSISSDVTGVNAIASDVTGVNSIASAVTAVNNNATNINNLATSANITAMGNLGTTTNVTNMANLNASGVITNMANLNASGVIANIGTTAGISTDVTTVANISTDVTSLANSLQKSYTVTVANPGSGNVFVLGAEGNAPAIQVFRGNSYIFDQSDSTNDGHPLVFKNGSSAYETGVKYFLNGSETTQANYVNTTTFNAGRSSGVRKVEIEIDATAPSSGLRYYCYVHGNGMGNTITVKDSNISLVAGSIANVNLTGNNITNVNTLAGLNTEVSNLGAIHTAISGVNTISSAVTGVNTISSDVTGVNAIASDVTTVANNVSGVNSFADRYRVESSPPTTSLDVGDLYFDTSANELKVYKSSGWAAAGSTVNGTSARFTYTISGTPTTVSGADDNGETLAYDAGFIDVFLNGVKQVNGTDVTVTSGTSVVFASALANGDVVDIVGFGTFNVAAIAGSAINSGTINIDRLPTITNAKLQNSAITINGSAVSLGGSVTVEQDFTWEIKTSAFTAVASRGYFVDTSSSAITATLPSSASIGDTIRFIDHTASFDTNNLTVGRNSHKIQGDASDMTVATERAGFALVYTDANQGWVLMEK